MNIKKYKDFSINESKVTEDEKYDVEQILAELTQDMGFDLELNKVYYSDNKREWHETFDTICKNPVLSMNLRKKGDVLEESTIEGLLPTVYECIGRLSELGEAELVKFSLARSFSDKAPTIDIKILLALDEKPELSDLAGFYDFVDFLNRRWRSMNNKVTRSFSIGNKDKESVVLENDVPGGATFTELKAFIRKVFNPWPNRTGRMYEFEFQKDGENMRLVYKGFKRLDHMGRPVVD
jgi:hypothetical protein